MSQPESKLSRRIMDALRARGVWCFKVHGGPMTMAGVPDIIACVPFRMHHAATVGLFVGLETKMPGNEPSAIQLQRHDDIRAAGGIVHVVHSVTEAIAVIDHMTGTTDPV